MSGGFELRNKHQELVFSNRFPVVVFWEKKVLPMPTGNDAHFPVDITTDCIGFPIIYVQSSGDPHPILSVTGSPSNWTVKVGRGGVEVYIFCRIPENDVSTGWNCETRDDNLKTTFNLNYKFLRVLAKVSLTHPNPLPISPSGPHSISWNIDQGSIPTVYAVNSPMLAFWGYGNASSGSPPFTYYEGIQRNSSSSVKLDYRSGGYTYVANLDDHLISFIDPTDYD